MHELGSFCHALACHVDKALFDVAYIFVEIFDSGDFSCATIDYRSYVAWVVYIVVLHEQ